MVNVRYIKELRAEKGKEQRDLGAVIGQGSDYYQKRESGLYPFSTLELKLLADYFGVTVDSLYVSEAAT